MSGAKQSHSNAVVDGDVVSRGEHNKKTRHIVTTARVQRTWSGPLPPPEIFKQYPKEVQRAIIQHADKQMKHRHKIENQVVASSLVSSAKGMNYAFWITLAMIGAGTFLVALGHSTAGLVAIFGTGGVQGGNYLLQKLREMHRAGDGAKRLSKKRAQESAKEDNQKN